MTLENTVEAADISRRASVLDERLRPLELIRDCETRIAGLERGEARPDARAPRWSRFETRIATLSAAFTIAASVLTGLVGYMATYRELLLAENTMVKDHLEKALAEKVTDVEHLRRIRFLMALDTSSAVSLLVPSTGVRENLAAWARKEHEQFMHYLDEKSLLDAQALNLARVRLERLQRQHREDATFYRQATTKWDFTDSVRSPIFVESSGTIKSLLGDEQQRINEEQDNIKAMEHTWRQAKITYDLEGREPPVPVHATALDHLKSECDSCTSSSCDMESCYEAAEIMHDYATIRQQGNQGFYRAELEYHTKACQGQYHASCAKLGRLYELGRGTEKDLVKAERYYRQACEANNPNGCNALGWYEKVNGSGDWHTVADLFKKACWEMTYLNACDSLGGFLVERSLTLTDRKEVAALQRQAEDALLYACGLGEIRACINRANFRASAGVSDFVR